MGDAPSGDPVAAARSAGRTTLTEAAGKRLLAGTGVPVPEFELADDPEGAAAAARRVGFPAVVKVSSPAVTHKSDWAGGAGVAVGIEDAAAVRAAAGEVLAAADDRGVDARVLVEAAADTRRGTEVIVGGRRDPSFGPTAMVGLGGVHAEVYDDVSHRLAPLSRGEARRAVEELRAARLLAGYRSRPPADVDALADAVRAVGDLLVARPAVATVEANPVLATPDGVLALDALVVLDHEGTAAGDAGSGNAGSGNDEERTAAGDDRTASGGDGPTTGEPGGRDAGSDGEEDAAGTDDTGGG